MGDQPDYDHGKDPGNADRVGGILESGAHAGGGAAVFRRNRIHGGGSIGRNEYTHAHADHQDRQGEHEVGEIDRHEQETDEFRRRDHHPGGGKGAGAGSCYSPSLRSVDSDKVHRRFFIRALDKPAPGF
jgi:hypothetical protein